MSQQLTIETQATSSGQQLGLIRLNAPKSLNALNLDMAQQMLGQLQSWQDDPSIVAVFIDGEGDKAFCAGGDVVAMYNAMVEHPKQISPFLQDFFVTEYQLDFLIHTYSKPIVLWGNGIVMGGGLGLMAGASHRVVTESSRIAMPEITIGLYPDVGGSYFLNKMPKGCGLFLGLTGASINATDALFVGLADYCIAHQDKQSVLETLKSIEWSADLAVDNQLVSEQLQQQALEQKPESHILPYISVIEGLADCENAEQVAAKILEIQGEDKWLSRAKASLQHGSPITVKLVFEQLQRAKAMSLAEVFQMEAVMSVRCGEYGEFQEGVRALLIDKDNNPNWQFSSVDGVDDSVIDGFFISPWQTHPLANLGE